MSEANRSPNLTILTVCLSTVSLSKQAPQNTHTHTPLSTLWSHILTAAGGSFSSASHPEKISEFLWRKHFMWGEPCCPRPSMSSKKQWCKTSGDGSWHYLNDWFFQCYRRWFITSKKGVIWICVQPLKTKDYRVDKESSAAPYYCVLALSLPLNLIWVPHYLSNIIFDSTTSKLLMTHCSCEQSGH